ncbi:hypothetical protein F4819DRAFT_439849 [Hypoxylon fuscum]|nr:hypothetical protein F4819DRAFT_439849 [Hypoxylon fuscum]
MSLNGLDDAKVKEAHEFAVAEPGGWYEAPIFFCLLISFHEYWWLRYYSYLHRLFWFQYIPIPFDSHLRMRR